MGFWEDEYAEMPVWEQECQELIQHIKDTAYNEVKDEVESMRNELKHLREIKARETEWNKEMQKLKEELVQAKMTAESAAKKMRIQELFGEHITDAWGVQCTNHHPKCNVCNGEGWVVLQDSIGEEYRVICRCQSKYIREYKPHPLVLLSLVDHNGGIHRYYGNKDEDAWENSHKVYIPNTTHDNMSNEELEALNSYNLVFESKERCQDYCDYMNKLSQEEKL